MALIICTECGKEFSDKAKSCPECGCPTEEVLRDIHRDFKANKDVRFDKLERVIDSVKREGIGNILEDAYKTICENATDYHKLKDDAKERLYENSVYNNQLYIHMRYTGWYKEIKVYTPFDNMIYKGEAGYKPKDKYGYVTNQQDKRKASVSFLYEKRWNFTRYENVADIYIDHKRYEINTNMRKQVNTENIISNGWRIESNALRSKFEIYDANDNNIAFLSHRGTGKANGYIVDFRHKEDELFVVGLAIAMDIIYSGYEPTTLIEKLRI